MKIDQQILKKQSGLEFLLEKSNYTVDERLACFLIKRMTENRT